MTKIKVKIKKSVKKKKKSKQASREVKESEYDKRREHVETKRLIQERNSNGRVERCLSGR